VGGEAELTGGRGSEEGAATTHLWPSDNEASRLPGLIFLGAGNLDFHIKSDFM
jgi:hypothetical protein